MEIFVQGEHKRKFITRNLSPKFSIIPSQFFPPNNIPSFNLVVREVFETPHNEMKCVLSIIELYPIEKMGQHFHICLWSGPTGLITPHPTPHPTPLLSVTLTKKDRFFCGRLPFFQISIEFKEYSFLLFLGYF